MQMAVVVLANGYIHFRTYNKLLVCILAIEQCPDISFTANICLTYDEE